jgi:REP element-mobilizing transposase RayT
MQNKLAILIPEGTYHVYNRANGSERIFLTEENYRFFMEKFKLYIQPVAEVYCYCLMPNHFHFLLRIKAMKVVTAVIDPDGNNSTTMENLISKQFSKLFSSYTQAFNKQTGRKGSLFMKNFKRKRVMFDSYFRNLVYYIHHNPLESRLCLELEDYPYSSYNEIINSKVDFVLKDELISYFVDLENFKNFHQKGKGDTESLALEI